ncbi:MAG: exo-alpha-sialidase [Chloroflexi bacterium]|nr:exo-alpha-sialidase [Chloroflexota bacterium]
MASGLPPKQGDILVLVGTRKGAFVFSAGPSRDNWEMTGPYWPGSDVFHAVYDARGDGRLWVVRNDPVFGSEIHRSDDLGVTWENARQGPQVTSTEEVKLNSLWHVTLGADDEPDVVYAGAEPATLFKSEDAGGSWHEIAGITSHPTRERWEGGFGGMCLHSIVQDPTSADRMWVGISAAGVFGTDDGGMSWQPLNKGVRADFMPETYPEVGQCPHKVVMHPAKPQTLYQQNHCGVFRSDDGGREWLDISEGLPSRFGLPMAIHGQDPDTVYVLPEDKAVGDQLGGGMRFVTDAKFRPFRSSDSGRNWEPLTMGLPQKNAYLHAMRDGMATDAIDPCGVYIGTSTGQLFFSKDEGDSWELLADYLPPINSVETGTIG